MTPSIRLSIALVVILSVGRIHALEPAAGERTEGRATIDRTVPPVKQRLREGTHFEDRLGAIQRSGQRYVFVESESGADRMKELRILENLTLERVMHVLGDNRPGRVWSVSGVVTEYQGENYLLLTRAVVKSTRSSESTQGRSPSRAVDPSIRRVDLN